jgi:hypothetical protein
MILDQNIMIGILAVITLALVADIFHLRFTLRKMFRNKKCGDVSDAIIDISKDVGDLEHFRKEMEAYLLDVEKRLRRSTQVAETVRFNAFRGDGVGGNQSFATAFLNEDGNGTILSSLYSRDRVSVFSKPISKFDSDIELSEEERRAVSLAKSKLKNNVEKISKTK